MSDASQIVTPTAPVSNHWRFVDLTGQKFVRLTVVAPIKSVGGRWNWLCKFECGTELTVGTHPLKTGNTKSCGCLKRETTSRVTRTHGQSGGPLYNTWLNMKARCLNPKTPHFRLYGGRGIAVCKGWMEFASFFSDMGNPPDGMSIDRKNNNGNYSCGHCEECAERGWPANCRWATNKEQRNNTRAVRLLSHEGKSMTATQWANHLGIKAKVILDRINKLNWTVGQALTAPRYTKRSRA